MADFWASLGTQYSLRLTVNLGAQEVANNRSRLDWSLTAIKNSGSGFFQNAATSGRVAIDTDGAWAGGQNYPFTIPSYTFVGKTFITLATGSTWVTHNPDGTKSVNVFGDWNPNNGTALAYGAAGGSMALTTIPRATTPTLTPSTVDAGVAVAIDLPRASTSFTHELSYDFAGLTNQTAGLSASSGVATAATFTPPLALLNQIPNAISGVLTLRVKTYSGATLIGEKTALLTLTVPATVVPTIGSITVTEATASPDVATLVGAYVRGISKLALTVGGAAGAYGSTIDPTKTRIDVAGQTIASGSGTTAAIAASGSVPITATVTDSRNRSATLTVNVTVLPYAPPSIDVGAVTITRCLVDGTPFEEGTYLKVAFSGSVQSLVAGTEKNALRYRISSRQNGDPAYVEAIALTTPGGLTFSSNRIIAGYAVDSSWDVLVEVVDVFATSAISRTVATSSVFQHWNGSEGIGLGKYHERGIFDAAGQMYQNSGLAVIDTGDLATTAVAGIAELATDAEAYAATSGSRVVTPANLGAIGIKENGRLGRYSNVTGTNWNSYTETGFYVGSAMTNAPSPLTSDWAMVEVIAHTSEWVRQYATDMHNPRRRWVRTRHGGTWGAWTSDYLQQTIGNQFIGGAFNAGVGNSGWVWWGELTVSFGTTFASIPNVNIYCETTGAVMYAVILSISTTSFTFRAVRLQAALATGFSYRWAATGPLA